MDTYTCLEDLSNEIFFEIFDYLHALDIFTAFASLNKRILSILQSIRLHVIILDSNYDREIKFLSSHLTYHADQVISLKCYDTIRDRSSIISLLFNRHHFVNLQSCIFMLDNSSTILANVIRQVESLNTLVAFFIIQPNYKKTNEKGKCDLTRPLSMNKSSSLRSVRRSYDYDQSDISTYNSIATNLTSLDLLLSGLTKTVSVYSILPIFRVCDRIRYLHVIIKHEILSENYKFNASMQELYINENDLPISPQVTSFDLSIFLKCSIHSIAYILRCMPNLNRFKFLYGTRTVARSFTDDLVNGYTWQHMFEMYTPFLSKFDFHISIEKNYPKLDLDIVINSFQYFVNKYLKWHMIIDRWESADNHLVNCIQSNDNDVSQQYGTYLSHIVHLPNVNQINFESCVYAGLWKDIQFILQACPNVIDLQINPADLVLSEFIDNQFLISIFKQIKILKSIRENDCVPSNFASKLVERFSSLTDIVLQVLSFDDCICVIDILLSHLKNLSYLKIYYNQVSSLDHPFSHNYIVDKRRETFDFNIMDEHKVTVSKNEESVEIRLS
ncbi:unnamed protein product [Rotaria sp. Silwood1]|nr:unnamed protein product [Rotaria sp. Silwood1]CAF1346260.1 unnamed protein product [Rotaria sp. Silwood1]CAF3547678.1 unnamed protein product [Rotaria sp. Silwood1]CAF3569458.1 unnamed protein product [Rotaria sp. Silwood1]CAF4651916.1 unnamed protein product [Rotaria sp. Silwood1]